MRLFLFFFGVLIISSCTKKNDANSNRHLSAFTVSVVDRQPNTALISWNKVENIFNSDTVKYDIVLNGKTVLANLSNSGLRTISQTLNSLSPDSLYIGRVYAKTISGDTVSAPFELEKIGGYIVYGDTDGSLHCIDSYTGIHRWKTPPTAGAYQFVSMPTVVDSTIYINTNSMGLFAINAKTGETIWSKDLGSSYPSGPQWQPAYQAGRLFDIVGTSICAFNSKDGQLIWKYTDADNVYQSNPVISGGLLFEYASNNKIIAVDINTGAKKWEYVMKYFVCVSPVVYKNLLIFGGSNSVIYALDQQTGNLVWSRNFGVYYDNFGADYVSPKIYKDLVIVHSGNSGYYGLDASTGATVWNFPGTGTPGISSPAIGNDMVYFSIDDSPANNKAIAINAATGVKVWEYTFDRFTAWPTPIFAKNRLYFGNNLTRGASMPVLNATTGLSITTFDLGVTQQSPEVVVAGDSVFYASQSGMVQ